MFTHHWTADDLPGQYVFFIAAVKTGVLIYGTLTNDEILRVATTSYSFQ